MQHLSHMSEGGSLPVLWLQRVSRLVHCFIEGMLVSILFEALKIDVCRKSITGKRWAEKSSFFKDCDELFWSSGKVEVKKGDGRRYPQEVRMKRCPNDNLLL